MEAGPLGPTELSCLPAGLPRFCAKPCRSTQISEKGLPNLLPLPQCGYLGLWGVTVGMEQEGQLTRRLLYPKVSSNAPQKTSCAIHSLLHPLADVDRMVLKCGPRVALDRRARGPAAGCFACCQTLPQEAVTTAAGRRAGAGSWVGAEIRRGFSPQLERVFELNLQARNRTKQGLCLGPSCLQTAECLKHG